MCKALQFPVESVEPWECLAASSLETNECTTPLSEMEFSDGEVVTSSSLDFISDEGAMDSSLYESEDEAFTHFLVSTDSLNGTAMLSTREENQSRDTSKMTELSGNDIANVQAVYQNLRDE